MTQGILEVLLALALLAGIATPRFAMVAAMMLVMFTMLSPTGRADPVVSRPGAGSGRYGARVLGAGRFSLDSWALRQASRPHTRWVRLTGIANVARGGNRDRGLLFIRVGMAYTLAASALFADGVFANPMNTSLPQPILLTLALLLAAGLGARYLMGGIVVWLLVIAIGKFASLGLLIGGENVKREIALAVIAAVYVAAGPDRWTLPRQRRLRCRAVSDLLAAYVDGELAPERRRAVEFHLADCPDCWSYLASYRQTVDLAKDLRAVDMPPEVYARLYTLVGDGGKTDDDD